MCVSLGVSLFSLIGVNFMRDKSDRILVDIFQVVWCLLSCYALLASCRKRCEALLRLCFNLSFYKSNAFYKMAFFENSEFFSLFNFQVFKCFKFQVFNFIISVQVQLKCYYSGFFPLKI